MRLWASQLGGSAAPIGSVSWLDIISKPATYTPSPHQHTIADITDHQAITAVQWADILGKPLVFPVETHSHTLSQISDLAGLTVSWGSITGKPTTYTPTAHTHVIGDVSGLQATLDGKASATHLHTLSQISDLAGLTLSWGSITSKPTTYTPSAHTHVIGDVSGLQASLDGKASATHLHTLSDISDLATLTLSWGSITSKPTTYTPETHTHIIGDITGLQVALDGKASATHAHDSLYLSVNGGTLSGSLGFSGVGRRLTGDMSNGTVSSRFAIQNSVANSGTYMSVIPNGTGTVGGINMFDGSDPNNSGYLAIQASGSGNIISVGKTGTGTAKGLTINTLVYAMGIGLDGVVSIPVSLSFGARFGQLITLHSSGFNVGIQNNTLYLRSAGSYSLFTGGVHSDTANDPGAGGTEIVRVDTNGLHLGATSSGVGGSAWYRSYGATGWFNGTYGGGWYQNNAYFISNYGNKTVRIQKDFDLYYGNIHLVGTAPTITMWDTDNTAKWLIQSNVGDFAAYRTASNAEAATDWVLKFQVRADGYLLSSALAGAGTRALSADPNGYIVPTASDERLKRDIQDSLYGLNDIMALRPITYRWKDSSRGSQKELGFIAQEVQQVLPEIVGVNSDGMLSLDYARVVPALVKAIQDLKKQIDERDI